MKGQVAFEFFIYAAVFLTVVLAAYFTIFFMQSSEVSAKESLYVKWFGESFASHANTAMTCQKGFNYTTKFETAILGKPYSVQFKPATDGKKGFVFITWSGNNASYTYPIGNMSMRAGKCVSGGYGDDGLVYYTINSSLGVLNFYNDGQNLTLSQKGCT